MTRNEMLDRLTGIISRVDDSSLDTLVASFKQVLELSDGNGETLKKHLRDKMLPRISAMSREEIDKLYNDEELAFLTKLHQDQPWIATKAISLNTVIASKSSQIVEEEVEIALEEMETTPQEIMAGLVK